MTTNQLTGIRPGTYLLDPARSSCRITATHVFGLRPVTGTMTLTGGTVTVAADPERSIASAELDAASFLTDDPRRDRDVRGRRFLDTANHPEIGFRSTGLHPDPEGWRMTGVLAVRGGYCDVTVNVRPAVPVGDGYRLTAACVVDRVAAGVTAGRALIARHIRIELDLCAIRLPAPST
ncbi:YceI family protein [Actinoplanes flavus]|uniref:YceI family protein n=1 Tax=Actinoplanes flavus TaxID=2820290 RepID=A0ABS3V0L3_9ACTN|nr:YceI family protein [Actinoplanes flavus]MBO3744321.1 YceI family protein [Actinoplanes flavus]